MRSPHSAASCMRDSACVGVFRLGSLDSTGLLKLVIILFAIFFADSALPGPAEQTSRLLLWRCASVHLRGEQMQKVALLLACETRLFLSLFPLPAAISRTAAEQNLGRYIVGAKN